jgi:LPS-assembly protein
LDTNYDDTDLSFRWPIGPNLELVGRWLYSLEHERTSEAFGGVEYGKCCWKVRALLRNYVDSDTENSQFAFMLQVELAGLGALGNRIDQFLERGVYGYDLE